MVGIEKKKVKIWLIRESKGSRNYYLTSDPEFVRDFKKNRRHHGNLVWCRCFLETGKYSVWTYMWALRTYLNLKVNLHISESLMRQSAINRGYLKPFEKASWKDTYRFTSYNENIKVIKEFRARLKDIERRLWIFRNILGEESVDFINLRDLVEPKRKHINTYDIGRYDVWRNPDKYEVKFGNYYVIKKPQKEISWWDKIKSWL